MCWFVDSIVYARRLSGPKPISLQWQPMFGSGRQCNTDATSPCLHYCLYYCLVVLFFHILVYFNWWALPLQAFYGCLLLKPTQAEKGNLCLCVRFLFTYTRISMAIYMHSYILPISSIIWIKGTQSVRGGTHEDSERCTVRHHPLHHSSLMYINWYKCQNRVRTVDSTELCSLDSVANSPLARGCEWNGRFESSGHFMPSSGSRRENSPSIAK